ncbi:hypothetical protein DRW03_33550 [Corallococcus sp. H22C18031201]|nr:hypothetical protein DRW03_33550 [Corallococcus sp. H22C18031201]
MPLEGEEAIQHAAVQAFSNWTRRLPVPPANPTDFIRTVEPQVRRACRLYSIITERQVVWKESTAQGSPRVTGVRRSADSVDPWEETQASLRESSLSVLACTPCDGRGDVACADCGGRAELRCSHCGGSRKAYGRASNGSRRLMNCKACGATGMVPCRRCFGGRLSCSTCSGSGREQRWLEFVESVRFDFLVMTEDEELRRLEWTTGDMEKDAKLVGQITANGVLTREKVAPHFSADWLQAHWGKTQVGLKSRERITRQSFQVFDVPTARVSYAITDAPPTAIGFEGQRMLPPPVAADRQFAARARKVFAARAALVAVAIGVPLLYTLRGVYFWNGLLLALSTVLGASAILAERFVQHSTLGRKERARRWGIGAAVSALLVGVLAVASEPRLDEAQRHISEGRLDDANLELLALGGPEEPGLQPAWTALHLAHALQEFHVDAVAKDALLLKPGSSERSKVEQHLQTLARKQVLAALERKDVNVASEVLASARPVLEQGFAKDLGELTARLHDTEYAGCGTDLCRWKALSAALRAEPTPSREQQLGQVRTALVEQLTPAPRPKVATLEWVVRLDKTSAVSTELGENPSDAKLGELAHQASVWAREERARIALIGADGAMAIALMDLTAGSTPNILTKTTPEVTLFCALKNGRCVGAYLVGANKGSRALNGSGSETTKALLARVLGHSVELPSPPKALSGKAPTQSSWRDGAVPLVARWSGTSLMELRIGDVSP